MYEFLKVIVRCEYILNRNAPLTPNSCDFYDLRTSVAVFFDAIYAIFLQFFFETEKHNPQTLLLLECMATRNPLSETSTNSTNRTNVRMRAEREAILTKPPFLLTLDNVYECFWGRFQLS